MTEHPDDHLPTFVDGTLAPRDTAAVLAHLDDCDVCRRALVDVVLATGGLRDTGRLALPEPPDVPPLDLQAALGDLSAVRRLPGQPVRRRPRPSARTVAAALALALVAGGGVVLGRTTTNSGTSRPGGPTVALGAHGQATMIGSGDARTMAVSLLGVTPGQGSYLEVWLLDTHSGRSLPVGVLPAAGVATFPLPTAEQAGFDAIDISRQRVGGPSSHSGDSVARGSLIA